MKKFITYIICSVIAVGLFTAPTFAESTESKIEPRGAEETNAENEVAPTFTAELNQAKQTSGLWAGKNFLLAGNEFTNYTDVKNGLLLAAGNSLQLKGISEYGFVVGNIVNFSGTTSRDLYIAGNIINLTKDATIGRDVFAAGNELYVHANLTGDLSVSAAKVILGDDVTIGGNANIDANEIVVGQNVTISGTLTYNDSAIASGIENARAGKTEVYHVEEVSASTRLAVALYAKFLSIAGLFIAMVLVLFFCPKLRDKVQAVETTDQLFANSMCGLGALAVIPIIAIFALFTIVGAPAGIIVLLLYAVGTYLAQGITGMWLGHALFSKITKFKVNLYIETLVGIALLGLVAFIPFVSIATGFASLAFGFGTIVSYIKSIRAAKDKIAKANAKSTKAKLPAKNSKVAKKAAKK